MRTDPDQVRRTLIDAPVPVAPQVDTPIGVAWLRAHVPRFREGAEHRRLRALVEAELDRLSPADLRARARAAGGAPPAITPIRGSHWEESL